MQSFKSKEYVRETFAWMHYYWYLTNEGIEFLRAYLNLPSEIVPATLKKQAKPAGGRPMGPSGDRPRYGSLYFYGVFVYWVAFFGCNVNWICCCTIAAHLVLRESGDLETVMATAAVLEDQGVILVTRVEPLPTTNLLSGVLVEGLASVAAVVVLVQAQTNLEI
ncbi:hypothetical protein JRO89_XS13G0157600 [Xanthoceras sorbifolium]|uniref:Plectin/eS10 N-terminal domain-containing protein n=1 Tax=Xanthoceras sorbifolium TaxID=99658 RepID=A0ABQ8H8J0_9ROSI|nr:hypothetical protein JRO89_XS13G0157600 [Xanthoceras sorbifolium]